MRKKLPLLMQKWIVGILKLQKMDDNLYIKLWSEIPLTFFLKKEFFIKYTIKSLFRGITYQLTNILYLLLSGLKCCLAMKGPCTLIWFSRNDTHYVISLLPVLAQNTKIFRLKLSARIWKISISTDIIHGRKCTATISVKGRSQWTWQGPTTDN